MSTTEETPPGVFSSLKSKLKKQFTPNESQSDTTFWLLGTLQLIFLVLLWELWRAPTIPGTVGVLTAFVNLVQTYDFWEGLFSSLTLAMCSLLAATAISLTLSYSYAIPFMRPMVTLFTKFRFFALLGLTIVPRILFEGSFKIRLSLLVFGVSVYFATGMMAVVRDIPRKRFEYLQTLGKTDWQVFWEIVVIETIPHAFENMRQNNAITFTLLPLVEVISRTGGGLGMMMWDSKKYGGPVATFAMELVLLLIGVCLDHLIKKGRLAACPHLEKKKGH